MDTLPHEIAIYLNDHLAGATAGVELARRIAHQHDNPALGELARAVERDRESLLRVMDTLGVTQDHVKVAGGWLGEKLGRLKLNGRLFSRSPLSYLIELEAMRMAVDGKAAGWQTLRMLSEHDSRLDRAHIDDLLARAEEQKRTLETLRIAAAAAVFTTPPTG
jgi:hypothetical protein